MELIGGNIFACYKHFIPTGLALLPTSFFNSVRSEMCIVVKYTCLPLIPEGWHKLQASQGTAHDLSGQ